MNSEETKDAKEEKVILAPFLGFCPKCGTQDPDRLLVAYEEEADTIAVHCNRCGFTNPAMIPFMDSQMILAAHKHKEEQSAMRQMMLQQPVMAPPGIMRG